jgi:hypothetical protein
MKLFQLPMNTMIPTATSAGTDKGRKIDRQILKYPHPSMIAASSNP